MTATHRVIWESQRPTREEFQMALEDYIGNGGVRGKIANVHSRETGWRVVLLGRGSHPLARIGNSRVSPNDVAISRGFGMTWSEDGVEFSFVPRADPITIAIGLGFVKFCIEHWKATEEIVQ